MKRPPFGCLTGALLTVTLFTGTSGRSLAADSSAPSADKLDRVTAFFDNEVATGKIPGAVILVQ